jgi:hypothetical protein
MQRNKLDVIIRARLRFLKLAEYLLERGEFANEDIGLVYFVSHDHQFLLCCKFDHVFDLFFGEGGSRRVSGVDNDDCPCVNTFVCGLLICILDYLEVCAPGLLFVKVVRDDIRIENGEGGGVEWILWDWDKDTGLGSCADDVQDRVDSRGSSSGKVD